MKEIWKDVVGYEGYYKVSNLGNVKSIDRYIDNVHKTKSYRKGKMMSKSLNRDGYYCVLLTKNNISKTKKVHRLVAIAFIDNPLNKKTVNHKDSNKSNNIVGNLEWNTYLENNLHCLKYGKRKFIINEQKIIKLYNQGYTMKQVAILEGYCTATVCKVLKNNNIEPRKQGKKGVFVDEFEISKKEGVRIEVIE